MSLILPEHGNHVISDFRHIKVGEDDPMRVRDFSILDDALAREREWYQDSPRYQTTDEILDAVASKDLVVVYDNSDHRKIVRFGEEKFEGHQPYVSFPAWVALHDIDDLWRGVEVEAEVGNWPRQRIAITSLTRSAEYQNQLVEEGSVLASPDSTHCTGNAIDIDLSGYYNREADRHDLPGEQAMRFSSVVDPRRLAVRQTISAFLAKEHGESRFVVTKNESQGSYDRKVTESIIQAATWLHRLNLVNAVIEYPDSDRECLHMAVNPRYLELREKLTGLSCAESDGIYHRNRFQEVVRSIFEQAEVSPVIAPRWQLT